jgi:hypothetical protein
MMIPLPYRILAGVVVLALAFGAGWAVRGWKADSDELEQVTMTQLAIDLQRRVADAAAVGFELARVDLDRQSYETQTVIRETYREIPVPAECAVPGAVADSLREAVEGANRAAAGVAAPAVP